jgi:hypothetical protein
MGTNDCTIAHTAQIWPFWIWLSSNPPSSSAATKKSGEITRTP